MLTREDALAIYHAGPETVVRVLLEMEACNSSKPSSTDGFQKPAPLAPVSPDMRGRRSRWPGSLIVPRPTGLTAASVAAVLWRTSRPMAWSNDRSTICPPCG